ncbi:DMT family transporter [Clostridium minihomine]|uniref:DMT family transporter n=1 Tax=Clostridium minihomine TaxID=2045012 RepID=UPI000C7572E2|nr:DMT family transporter [Clostridium minihomine]
MYYTLAFVSGILVALMVACNGGLSSQVGTYSATVIIHIIGLSLIGLWILLRRENPFAKRMPWLYYSGGAIGVIITAFQIVAYDRISVSAILALGLLGQSVASIIADRFGLINGTKQQIRPNKFLGLFLVAAGIAVMITEFDALSVFFSFAAGAGLVIARTLNAQLADNTSIHTSTFFNFLVGLSVSVPLMILLGQNEPLMTQLYLPAQVPIYLGGVLGVATVLLFNTITTKISAFNMTLFIFIGQIFSGILLDTFLSGTFMIRNLLGGLLVTIGLIVNLLIDSYQNNKATCGTEE